MALWRGFAIIPLLNHPLILALNLILLSLFLGGLLGFLSSSWIRIALILIFLGGIIVIFVYFTSLVSNEKLTLVSKSPLILSPLLVAASATSFLNTSLSVGLFNFRHLIILINLLLISYLLIALFIVVELTSSFKGAVELRSS